MRARLPTDLARQVRREFGFVVEPLALHAAVPALALCAWRVLRESLVADGPLPRASREVIATSVSRANACPYCVEAHGILLAAAGSGGPASGGPGAGGPSIGPATGDRPAAAPPTAGKGGAAGPCAAGGGAAERPGAPGDDPDTGRGPLPRESGPWPGEMDGLAAWAAATCRPGELQPPPCPASAWPQAWGTVYAFQYINRMVSVFLDESPIPTWARRVAARPARALSVRCFRRALARPHPPGGGSCGRGAPGWALGRPALAGAIAAFETAAETEAERRFGAAALGTARRTLAAWDLAPAPLHAIDPLHSPVFAPRAEETELLARAVLCVARAPQRFESLVLAHWRNRWPDDAALVTLASWASLGAARRLTDRFLLPAPCRGAPAPGPSDR